MSSIFVPNDYLKFTSLPFRYYIYSMKVLLAYVLHCTGYLHSIDYCSSAASIWRVSFHEVMLSILPRTMVYVAPAHIYSFTEILIVSLNIFPRYINVHISI
jgi:uncharacterized protein involved in cysteine biosynthesis